MPSTCVLVQLCWCWLLRCGRAGQRGGGRARDSEGGMERRQQKGVGAQGSRKGTAEGKGAQGSTDVDRAAAGCKVDSIRRVNVSACWVAGRRVALWGVGTRRR